MSNTQLALIHIAWSNCRVIQEQAESEEQAVLAKLAATTADILAIVMKEEPPAAENK